MDRGDTAEAAALMKPTDNELLQRWPVSKQENSSRASNDDRSLIALELGISTPEEIAAATVGFARQLGQCSAA